MRYMKRYEIFLTETTYQGCNNMVLGAKAIQILDHVNKTLTRYSVKNIRKRFSSPEAFVQALAESKKIALTEATQLVIGECETPEDLYNLLMNSKRFLEQAQAAKTKHVWDLAKSKFKRRKK